MSAWPTGKNTAFRQTVEQMRQAIVNGDISHNGDSGLVRHFLNARRRQNRQGYSIFKANPESPDKIDAAVASVNAFKARLDALSKGLDKAPKPKRVNRARFF